MRIGDVVKHNLQPDYGFGTIIDLYEDPEWITYAVLWTGPNSPVRQMWGEPHMVGYHRAEVMEIVSENQ
jgi:hypothetical protein